MPRRQAQAQAVNWQYRAQTHFKKPANKSGQHYHRVGAHRMPQADQADTGGFAVLVLRQARNQSGPGQADEHETDDDAQRRRVVCAQPGQQRRSNHHGHANHGGVGANQQAPVLRRRKFGDERLGQHPAHTTGHGAEQKQHKPCSQLVGEQKPKGGQWWRDRGQPQRIAPPHGSGNRRCKWCDDKNTQPFGRRKQAGHGVRHLAPFE